MLKEELEVFIHTLNQKKILKPLYKNRNMMIEFITDSDSLFLQFKDGVCELVDAPSEDTAQLIHVSGSLHKMFDLISGKTRLMELKNGEELAITGKDSALLALESLFILANTENNLLHNHT